MLIKKSLFNLFKSAPSKSINGDLGDDRFLISQIPPEGFPLRNRKFGGCAHYSLKAVIEGKNRENKPIEHYSVDWRSGKTYLMTPRGIIKVLKKHDLDYSVVRVKNLSDDKKLSLLKEKLRKGPMILLVANGQTNRKWFSWGKALTHWHYISLWGYDDKEKIFYVYDSNTRRKTSESIMKGTLKIPYKYILKEWGIGASKLINNYAIAVDY